MQETPAQSLPLQTRQHFKILDGLRGVAALAVVVFHFMEIAVPDYNKNFIAHAYLAVDFFFCLSGFVMAYAYDEKLKQIGVSQFFKLRLIRLHPLVVIGSIIGLITFIFDPLSDLYLGYSAKIFMMFLASIFMVPYPIVRERYFNLFHLNPPTWSLFWEYVANIVYALIFVRLPKKVLWVLLAIAAIALCNEAVVSKNLSVGWGGDNIHAGALRASYSFLAGMLVYRSKWIIRSNINFIASALLLLVALLMPYSDNVNFITDSLIVIFYFPFLVALGAGGKLGSASTKACEFSGNISYPLYMTHYPFIWIFMSYVESRKPPMNEMVMVIIPGVIFMILFAYCIMTWVDTPIRAYFMRKMKRNASSKTEPAQ